MSEKQSSPGDDVLDLDNLQPAQVPGLGISDLLKWAPVVQILVQDVEQALSGGSFDAPPIKIRVSGKRVTIGPTPIKVGD